MHIYGSIAISMNKLIALGVFFLVNAIHYPFCHENITKIRGGKTFFFINIKNQNITQQMHDFE